MHSYVHTFVFIFIFIFIVVDAFVFIFVFIAVDAFIFIVVLVFIFIVVFFLIWLLVSGIFVWRRASVEILKEVCFQGLILAQGVKAFIKSCSTWQKTSSCVIITDRNLSETFSHQQVVLF